MVWYVLNNSSQAENMSRKFWPLYFYMIALCLLHMLSYIFYICRMFKEELERQGVANIEKTTRLGFQIWFRNHVSLLPQYFR
jgi:hypothetical protein